MVRHFGVEVVNCAETVAPELETGSEQGELWRSEFEGARTAYLFAIIPKPYSPTSNANFLGWGHSGAAYGTTISANEAR